MKKTVLTFVAVAFGSCVAFAQTTPPTDEATTADTEQTLVIDKMSNKPEEAGRRAIKVEELPEAVQLQLQGDEFKTFTIITVTEVQAAADAQPAAVQYEVALTESAAATTEPSLVVLFDEKGQLLGHKEAASEKIEE